MTMIPVCSLRSSTSNIVDTTLHSNQSSHIKQSNMPKDLLVTGEIEEESDGSSDVEGAEGIDGQVNGLLDIDA